MEVRELRAAVYLLLLMPDAAAAAWCYWLIMRAATLLLLIAYLLILLSMGRYCSARELLPLVYWYWPEPRSLISEDFEFERGTLV